jgi:hypothetical protein
MNKEFIPYEQALELKELGFNELCLFYYTDNESLRIYHQSEIYDDLVGAPLYQQAFRWFREKYGIMYTVDNNIIGNTFHGSYTKINSDYQSDYTDDFATYEEAELACLKKLIEIVKQK